MDMNLFLSNKGIKAFWVLAGCQLDACEIDEEYFNMATTRLKKEFRQLDLFR